MTYLQVFRSIFDEVIQTLSAIAKSIKQCYGLLYQCFFLGCWLLAFGFNPGCHFTTITLVCL